MNTLTIPPSPNWYENSILSCASDNTIVYGSRNELVIIKPQNAYKPVNIESIPFAHYERIVSTDVNRNWNNPDKLAVSAGDDKLVKLWDIETCSPKLSHRGHTTQDDRLVGAKFAGNDKIVSVSENGLVILWRLGLNELTEIPHLLGTKAKVTTLSVCLHTSWLVAFGLKSGLIVVTDLRKSGRVLHRLKGHDKGIISLTWCPAPYNILPKQESEIKVNKGKNNEDQNDQKFDVNSTIDDESNASQNAMKMSVNSNGKVNVEKEHDSITNNDELQGAKENEENMQKYHEQMKKSEVNDINDEDQEDKSVGKNGFEISTEFKEDTEEEIVMIEDFSKRDEKVAEKNRIAISKDFNEGAGEEERVMIEGHSERVEKVTEKNRIEISNDFEEDTGKEDKVVIDDCSKREEKALGKHGMGISKDFKEDTGEEGKTMAENYSISEIQKNSKAHFAKKVSAEKIEKDKDLEDGISKHIESKDAHSDDEKSLPKNENQVQFDSISEFSRKYKEEQSKREFLLASSARGGSVIIWRAGTDGRMHCELQQGKSHGKKNYRNNDDKIWVSLLWTKPDTLLFSRNGDLMQWDLWKPKMRGKFYWKVVDVSHSGNIFCISAPTVLFQTKEDCEDWQNQEPSSVWTVGQDRYLLNTSLGTDKRTLSSYPTIGGHVVCFAASDLDPNKVAVGFADGQLRIWDLSLPNLQVITMTMAWQKSLSKVVSVAWHPSKETCLAFGTTEGRVGLLNTSDLSKSAKFLTHYLQHSVHKIEWGPLKGDVNNLGLYACSEGKIIVYDTSKHLEEPTLLNLSEYVSNMAWKQDYSLVAVGLRTGAVMIFTPEFQLVTTFLLQKKIIQCMAWHPLATAEDDEMSPYSDFLAVSSNDNYIMVYDCSRVEDKTNGLTLQGHFDSIKSLSWSPHEGGKLVSGSDDGTSLVWDVPKRSVISTHLANNLQTVTAVMWSPLDPDYVIQGGRECSIQIWKISENPPRTDLNIPAMKKNRMKDSKEVKKSFPGSSPDAVESEISENKKKQLPRNLMLQLVSNMQRESSPNLLDDCKQLLELHEAGNIENGGGDSVSQVAKFLGNREQFLSFLREQEQKHKDKNRTYCLQHITLWKGDISEKIKDAIANGKLNPWLINMAPMVSPKLWQEASLAYAQALSEDPKADPLETASYFLACHKLEDAVEVLCNATFFREALTIAKCRLSSADPLINNILLRWATYCIITGNFEVATQCFIAMGQLEEATKAIFRRSDIKSLEFALELAEKTSNKDLYNAVIFRLNAFKSEIKMTSMGNEVGGAKKENEAEYANGSNNEEVSNSRSIVNNNSEVETHKLEGDEGSNQMKHCSNSKGGNVSHPCEDESQKTGNKNEIGYEAGACDDEN